MKKGYMMYEKNRDGSSTLKIEGSIADIMTCATLMIRQVHESIIEEGQKEAADDFRKIIKSIGTDKTLEHLIFEEPTEEGSKKMKMLKLIETLSDFGETVYEDDDCKLTAINGYKLFEMLSTMLDDDGDNG